MLRTFSFVVRDILSLQGIEVCVGDPLVACGFFGFACTFWLLACTFSGFACTCPFLRAASIGCVRVLRLCVHFLASCVHFFRLCVHLPFLPTAACSFGAGKPSSRALHRTPQKNQNQPSPRLALLMLNPLLGVQVFPSQYH